MSHACGLPSTSLAAPLLDPGTVAAAGRAVRTAVRVGGLVLGSLAAAAVIWLVLAGPGFLAGDAGAVRVARVVAR